MAVSINKTSYGKLKKYETIFLCVTKSNYAHCTRQEYMEIIDAYYATSALKAPAMSAYNCSRCKLKELKKIATEYFVWQEENVGENGKIKQDWNHNPYKKDFYK